jgi:pSer/pThr/pTyr-binding forkhead associated (FHA) protein
MPKLVFEKDGAAKEWDLGSFLIAIGRRPENNIVLDDKFVSGRHAVVGFAEGRYYVEDLKSSNGTLLNGKPVQRANLNDGDRIRIGALEIRFIDQPAPSIPLVPTQPVSATDPSATAEADLLDELVGSIRSHREREQREREEAVNRVAQEWEKLLAMAEQIKAKVSGDPRVKHFGIDRKAADVMIRIQRDPRGPQKLITMALRHPDYRDQVLNGIWLLRTGEPERCLPTAQAVGSELVRELAFLLA